MLLGWYADIFIEYIFRVFFHVINLLRSRGWQTVTAIALSAECPPAGYGCTVATVYYEYVVDGEKYGDWFGKPFIFSPSGKDYAAKFAKGTEFKVRVKPGDATKSFHPWERNTEMMSLKTGFESRNAPR